MSGGDLYSLDRDTEVFGDLLAHGDIGLAVDGCCGRSYEQASRTFSPDRVSLGPRYDPNWEQCRLF
jgi:hypothetical protein